MPHFLLRRLARALVTLFGISLVAFALVQLSPGDPARLFAFGVPNLTVQEQAALRAAYGLDRPLPAQYLAWLGRTLQGDFGQSFLYRRPAGEVILAALPSTLQLVVPAALLSLAVGVGLGVVAAWRRGTAVDQIIRLLSVAGEAVPGFWFGLLFITVFAVQLRLLPVGGMLSVGRSEWDLLDRLAHLVGPVLTLSLGGIASYVRLVRAEMLEVLQQDFIRAAYARGLGDSAVLGLHALRNALLPVITALGGVLASIMSGSLVVEQVFAWPGIGRMAFEAARAKDYPIVMGVVLLSGSALLLGYLLRDLAYRLADPRIRTV